MARSAIDNQIGRLRRRVRLLLVERGALYGAAVGTVAAALIVLLSSRFDALIDYYLWCSVVACGTVAGTGYGLLRRLDNLAIAVAADKRTGLRERLSTALSIHSPEGTEAGMERATVNDAVEHISGLKSREVFRHKFGMPHGALCVGLVVLLAAILVPLMPAMQSKARRAEVRTMKHEGAKLIRVAKEIKREAGPKQAELKKLANRLYDLGKKMESGRLAKKNAMLQTRRLTKDVQREQDRLAQKNATTRSMDQVKLDMKKAGDELAKHMAMKLAAKDKLAMTAASEKLKMDSVPSDKKLAELANKAGALTPSEQKALEKALSKYADPKNSTPVPKELGEALAKLMANKDYRKAMEIIQKLAQKLNTGKMDSMDKEMLAKQLEALSKALKNTDFDKLSKSLLEQAQKLAAMSPEELEKLVKELEEMQKMAKLMDQAGAG